jgi:hypothetical protein
MPFPFLDNTFPPNLGAVVQRTVLDGVEPARVVIHDDEGDWVVGDAVNDPNQPGASVVACIAHIADHDQAVAELAVLPVGHVAERDGPGSPWRITAHQYSDD